MSSTYLGTFLVLAGLSLAAEQMPYISPGEIHKVQVGDREAARETVSRGSKLIADYGSFQLIEVDRSEFDRLTAAGGIARDEYNLVQFNGRSLDTSVEPAQPPVAGRSLYAIQFWGPVRSEWMQAVEAAGVRMVTPISYNAYLALGTEAALSLAAKAPGVQWSAPYAASYKIDPRLNSSQRQPDQVAIQLVEDADWNSTTLALIEASKGGGEARVSKALGYVNIVATVGQGSLGRLAGRPDVISIQPYATPRRQ